MKLVDEGKYAASWEEISMELKAKFTKESWIAALQPLSKQAGALKTRRFKNIIYTDLQAEIVPVEFDRSFAKAPAVTEIVNLKLEADGKWRVSGYSRK